MYTGVEKSELVEDIINAIRNLDSKNLGFFLDALYLKLKENPEEYQFLLDSATDEMVQNLTASEMEEQDEKIKNSKSDVIRWRSYHEISFTEYITQEETFTHFGIRRATNEEKEQFKKSREYRKKLRETSKKQPPT